MTGPAPVGQSYTLQQVLSGGGVRRPDGNGYTMPDGSTIKPWEELQLIPISQGSPVSQVVQPMTPAQPTTRGVPQQPASPIANALRDYNNQIQQLGQQLGQQYNQRVSEFTQPRPQLPVQASPSAQPPPMTGVLPQGGAFPGGAFRERENLPGSGAPGAQFGMGNVFGSDRSRRLFGAGMYGQGMFGR